MPIPMTPGLVAELERAELNAWRALFQHAPARAVTACGIGSREFGPALATWMSKVDFLACNRALGLGLHGAPDPKVMEEIVATYEQAMVPRFLVQLAPLVTVGPAITAAGDVGFAWYNNWVRLVRDVAPPGPAPTELRVEEIGKEDAGAFGAVLTRGFGWGLELGLPVEAMVGTPGWKCYLAFDGDRPVACAALVVDGRIGWFGLTTTLPEGKSRGGHSALLARRIMDARVAGCELLTVEAAEQPPGHEARSYQNLLRTGFEVGYLRPNYLYTFQQRDGA